MGNERNEITLYKNLKKRLREENLFEIEPVEESKELELIEAENNSVVEFVEFDVCYEIHNEEELNFKSSDIIEVNCTNSCSSQYEDEIQRLNEKNFFLKNKINLLNKEIDRLKEILTREQKLFFCEEDDNCNFENNLTKAERLLLEKREELSRRSFVRKKNWLKQMLG